jgi:uncharacterized protein (TIGR02147 family)
MVSILSYENYRDFLKDWIRDHPRGGHGVKQRLAERLGVSSTLISFVLSGKKKLTLEQASDLADHMKLRDLENEYLFLLVEIDRAGTHRLRAKLEKKLEHLKKQGHKITHRVVKDRELTEEVKAVFYSNWLNTGLRNLLATGNFRTPREIAERLMVGEDLVAAAIQFMLEQKLVVEDDGVLRTGPTYTHLEGDSPFVDRHRQNWHIRGFVEMERRRPEDLFYSSPMSMSRSDVHKVKSLLLKVIDETLAIMRPSPSEEAVCLNIDWFKY